MKIPIIIFHIGKRDYVRYCLQSALYYENKDIILLHDDVNAYQDLPITVVDYKKYNQYDNVLKQLYVHLSPNSEQLEYICIQRWFCIYSYMRKHHIARAFICDSDVLLFDNISKINKKYLASFDYMLCSSPSNNITGGQSIWNIAHLNQFIQFVLHFYRSQRDTMIKWYSSSQDYGGICDMTLLYYFAHQCTTFQGLRLPHYPSIQHDLTQVYNNKFTFDLHIGTSGNQLHPNEYKMDGINTIKKISISDYHNKKVPVVYNNRLRKYIRFALLHFQGSNKKWMETYYHKIIINNNVIM